MNAPLIKALGIRVRGVSPLERLAGLIVVGMELRHVKTSLGYCGGGSWQVYRGEVRPTWEDLCRAQAGFTETTERNLYQCFLVVKARLAAAETNEAGKILSLMEMHPSGLTDDDRNHLVAGICLHGLREGDTQASLRTELRMEPEAGKVLPIECRPDVTHAIKALGPAPDYIDPEMYLRDLTAVGMAVGLRMDRAREVAILMMPEKSLSLHDIARKREILKMSTAFLTDGKSQNSTIQ